MFWRLLFAFVLLSGLATSPLSGRVCSVKTVEMKCGNCCGASAHSCCAKPGEPAGKVPAQNLPTGSDLKMAVVPVLVWLGQAPVLAQPPGAACKASAAQMPVRPRVEQTCIRLV